MFSVPRPQLVLVVLGLAVVLAGFVAVVRHSPAAPGDGPIADLDLDDPAVVERGAYLARAGNCATCHTAPGGAPFAGGLAFETPFGTVHSTNITPDADTGIGRWSARDLLNSLRHGVRPDGARLYPAFPYTAYTRMTDADVAALWAWLRTVEPVATPAVDNDLAFPFNLRPLLAFWNLLFLDAGPFEPDPARSEDWNRGAYLVEALAHCSACHTPRNVLGAQRLDMAYAGGEYLDRVPGGAHRPWSAPNLTSSERGLGLWSRNELAAYLGTGRTPYLESFGPMNEVILHSTRHLATADVDAMAGYLKSLPAIDPPATAEPDRRLMGRGRTVYNLHCGTCHLPTGLGDPEMGPRLNGTSLVVQDPNPASMLNVVLYSPQSPAPPLPTPDGLDWRHPMDEFQWLLDDEEIAAVATYVRHSWDNAAGVVTPAQVERQRVTR